MPYDGTLLSKARAELDKIRQKNEEEHDRRLQQVYRTIPDLEMVDARLRSQMITLVRLTLSKDPDLKEKLAQLEHDNIELQAERAEMLVEAGFPMDYLDDLHSCTLCGDTGMVDGKYCSCLMRIYNRFLTNDLSPLIRSGEESFDHFDLSYYPAEYDFNLNATPREIMRAVLESCRKYAERFPENTPNLLMQGGTGLGKTYLSACIARVVADKGCSVCYDSAISAFETFEKQRFSRDPDEVEVCTSRIRRMMDCDLMILDDLGTELVTSVTNSSLYFLINTRIKNGKPTIISTNCPDEELQSRYTSQICSRLLGEYKKIPFCGKDIRLLRKGR